MKKHLLFLWLACCIYGCNDPTDVTREDEYMHVYIPLTIEKNSVLQTVPIVYNDVNFVAMDKLDFSKDTLLLLGAYCGGTNLPAKDIRVEFSLATDTLLSLQNKPVPQAIYQLLPENYYSVNSWSQTIPKRNTNCYMEIEIKLTQIPEGSKFILPVKVNDVSNYAIDPEKSFILLGIDKPVK